MLKSLKNEFKKSNSLLKLIYINLGVFFLYNILFVCDYLLSTSFTNPSILIEWLALPVLPLDLLKKIWTIITYMFLHQELFHLFFNLFGLYFIGTLFLRYLNSGQLIKTYILGGICSGLFFILSFNLFPALIDEENLPLIGASGSIFAILFSIATRVPNLNVFFDFKLKHLALFLVVFNFFYIPWDPGACIAHLGGAFYGFVYINRLNSGIDITIWPVKLLNSVIGILFSQNKSYDFENRRTKTDQQYRNEKVEKRKIINKILEKISKSGYESLTAKEKEVLFKESKK